MNDLHNFIYKIIDEDLRLQKCTEIRTRFPPEPNGYLHIGHAKSICLNFGIAKHYGGQCNLRFDDTNPDTEQIEYVEAIKNDIQWLGFMWDGMVRYSSDYSELIYQYALELIKKGLAYVDELSVHDIRKYRGTLTQAGQESPYRCRSIKDNLVYFYKMRNGEFAEGSVCLRAKIDMSNPIIVMRDPVLYRIKYTKHHRLGSTWCIYPTYDFSHCIADAIEGITHSLCTLEFQDNRRLYNWILKNISINKKYPMQYEFSRLNLEYVISSKRKLSILVNKHIVDGWDDPRMPTISGLRRRGYTAQSIRKFCRLVGISKQDSKIKLSLLESCIRDELNTIAIRLMAVINPVKVIIKNLPLGYVEKIVMPNHPNNLYMGTRDVIFSREIFIDRRDFYETHENSVFLKLAIGKEVRLRHAYIIQAKYFEKDKNGNIVCIYCTYDENTLNKNPADGRKVHRVIHWVSATKNIPAEFRLYDKLFMNTNPSESQNLLSLINPTSLIISQGFVENTDMFFRNFGPYQFEREGYFVLDCLCSTSTYLVFNRTVTLKKRV